jgi:GH15 family glucan-1,4-alpha-glucosidase
VPENAALGICDAAVIVVAGRSIGDYAIIGDGRSAALVSKSGAIDWLCWPRFDSASIFGAILDAERGGLWRICPSEAFRSTRNYASDTNILVTRFETSSGAVTLTDLMPIASEEDKRGRLLPEHVLLRSLECERGEVAMELRFEPRPDYGSLPKLRSGPLGIRLERRGELFTLRSAAPLEVSNGRAIGRVTIRQGQRLGFILSYDSEAPAVLLPLECCSEEIERSAAWWRRWARKIRYNGPYRELVVRSALALKLLIFAPSGALVAAPTTSLPEKPWGDLNWDYRFCWLRDAAITVRCLIALGFREEASAFVGWLIHTTRLTRPELCVLYDVYGNLPKGEITLDHLAGFEGARPVRVRNAAASQLQLDVYGEVIDAASQLFSDQEPPDRETQRLLIDLGTFVCERWDWPDHGIWEPREAPRHHTHSRALCWVALDRLLSMHERGLIPKLPKTSFMEARQRIAFDIETRGWSSRLQTYTHTFGGTEVDAALLLLGWYGFRAPEDPRMRCTYRRIREVLDAGPGLLHRNTDSRDRGEGAFGACSGWVTEHLARGGGTLEQAEAYLERFSTYANDVGLFGEEIDPATGAALGNFPQAFTHVGLISAALAVAERERKERSRRPPPQGRQEVRP